MQPPAGAQGCGLEMNGDESRAEPEDPVACVSVRVHGNTGRAVQEGSHKTNSQGLHRHPA